MDRQQILDLVRIGAELMPLKMLKQKLESAEIDCQNLDNKNRAEFVNKLVAAALDYFQYDPESMIAMHITEEEEAYPEDEDPRKQ
uniref:Uncharacterized protein n=1 Tax=Ditylenchus dipsaci TaxID=166011 RepID=A0A915CU66_9BILA